MKFFELDDAGLVSKDDSDAAKIAEDNEMSLEDVLKIQKSIAN
ncbi:hypothetical protein [Fibrobacter sp. UWEL]|nr:hypothetical protein [Fibrobacter sp. UWEL]